MSASPALPMSIDNLIPFRRSSERHAAVPAAIEGTLPDWLRG